MNENMTLLEVIGKELSRDEILFDRNDMNFAIRRIPSDLRKVVLSNLKELDKNANLRYSGINNNHFEKNGNTSRLVNGPLEYLSFDQQGYQIGDVHQIKVDGIEFSRVINSTDIKVHGKETYLYNSKEYNNAVVDTHGDMEYVILYDNNGNIKEINTQFKVYNIDRNKQIVMDKSNILKFNFSSMEELLEFKKNIQNAQYAKYLLDNAYQEVKEESRSK